MRWKSRQNAAREGNLRSGRCMLFADIVSGVIVRYWWVVGKIHSVPGASVEGDFGTTAGKWLGALLGMLVLGGIGSILGAVVWYTRPSRGEQDHQR